MRFLKPSVRTPNQAATSALGSLELAVMEILWTAGECNVHEVARRLHRPLAYTTVMTTLYRLFRKGLLHRRKVDRAFFYAPQLSRNQWSQKRTGQMMADLLAAPTYSGELLISCLVEAVGEHGQALLDELEEKIQN